jgi:tetratricopeptide (TPR) repeat protein
LGEIFWAADRGDPAAAAHLTKIAADAERPAIIRASAIQRFLMFPHLIAQESIRRGTTDISPLVRLSALSLLTNFPVESRLDLARPLLADPVRSVRMEAARLLAAVAGASLSAGDRTAFDMAWAEYMDMYRLNADRPETHMNMGLVYTEQNDYDRAEEEYKEAVRLSPFSYRAYVNLADIYRVQGEDYRGEEVLREAVTLHPDNAGAQFALGLLLVRKKHREEALNHLRAAAEAEPDNARFAYVYGIGLQDIGRPAQALEILENASARHPFNADILVALANLALAQGQLESAAGYARRLLELYPANPQFRQLLGQIEAMRAR